MTINTKEQSPELSKRYSLQKHIVTITSVVAALFYIFCMVIFGSDVLKYIVSSITTNQYLLIALYVLAFTMIIDILMIPLSLYGGFVLEHMYNLSNQKFSGWIVDEVKKVTLSLALIIIMVEIMYLFLRNFPNSWWIFIAMIWILFSIIMAKLAPVLIFPLFYKSVPIDNEELKAGLASLAQGTGITIRGVYKINLSKDTKKANAALAGMGSTRRVLLADTLLDSYSPDEIQSVFAHELGHHVYYHVWKMLAVGAVTGFSGFALCHYVLSKAIVVLGYQHIHDIAAFPVVCLVLGVFGFFLMPIQNGFSRRLERACDRYAIAKTRNPDAFVSAMNKLAEQNLSDRNPNRIVELLFYSHPPVSKRIEMAKESQK